MAEAIFNYEGTNTTIQCNINDKMRNVIDSFFTKIKENENNLNSLCFLYNGNKINKELTFNEQANDLDKNRKKMNIIVTKINEDLKETNEIISKNIICPECKENSLIDIDNFKIDLSGCKNNHHINNIFLNEFNKTQTIDLNTIICTFCNQNNKGNTHNNEFFYCNNCNKNICPLCKSIHDKNHNIINYDDKNYICRKHNDSFIKYCNTCKENICIICEDEHQGHNISDFRKILINKDVLTKTIDNLKNKIEDFKYKINIIKEIFDRIIENLDTYYKINEYAINNYNPNKRNYHKLQNLYNLKNNNENIIKYLDNIINNNQIFEIYKLPNDKFSNANNEIYLGELKNDKKDGRGIIFYKKNDSNDRKKYIGDFKNDQKEGKGIIYWNDGEIFEGNFKSNIREGKGIDYFSNGDRYEGDYKDDKKEEKGIYYYNNGDRYDGDWKNNLREGSGIFYFINGDKEIGHYMNGNKIGNHITMKANGEIILNHY